MRFGQSLEVKHSAAKAAMFPELNVQIGPMHIDQSIEDAIRIDVHLYQRRRKLFPLDLVHQARRAPLPVATPMLRAETPSDYQVK
jgi:hypothetical protein